MYLTRIPPLLFWAALIFVAKPVLAETGHKSVIWTGLKSAGKLAPNKHVLGCQDCLNEPEKGFLPHTFLHFEGKNIISLQLLNPQYAPLTTAEIGVIDTNLLESSPKITYRTGSSRGIPQSVAIIMPLIKTGGKFLKLTSFDYKAVEGSTLAKNLAGGAAPNFAASSVLASGTWYKLAVPTERGIYRIDNAFLRSLGIDPNSIDPRNIKLYGNGGLQQPQPNWAPRLDDLTENPILVQGQADGKFDASDYILFYSTGTVAYTPDVINQVIRHKKNIYSDSAFYFLTIGNSPGLRITTQPDPGPGSLTYTSYDQFWYHDIDKLNVIKSGREWFGEVLDFVNNITIPFDSPNLIGNSPIKVNFSGMNAGQNPASNTVTNTFTANLNGNQLFTIQNASVNLGSYTDFGNVVVAFSTLPNGLPNNTDQMNFYLKYDAAGLTQASGYINYIEINAQSALTMEGKQTFFRVFDSKNQAVSTYQVNASSTSQVWDVTNPVNPVAQPVSVNGNTVAFNATSSDTLHEYLVFDGNNFPSPTFVKRVNNQNLHSVRDIDLLIVSPGEFRAEANRLADFRRTHDKLTVLVASTEEIYNEFGSGAQDIMAIRQAARSLYFQSTQRKIKYLLLFGDCSYDYLHRTTNNTNYVPIWESEESMDPINSFCSDDFYGFMETNKGAFTERTTDLMDVAVGRIPAKSAAEAADVVDKLIHYAAPASFGKWRNNVTYVADNGDGFLHQGDADGVANTVEGLNPAYTPSKLYLGAFQTIASPGGYVSPDCKKAIKLALENGTFILNYSGHGNEIQWADEKIFDMDMISSLNNYDKLPLFITATCDFGRHDDPSRTSGAEAIVLKTKGAGIAIVSTCRPSFADANQQINYAFTNAAFTKVNGKFRRLGDTHLAGKNGAVLGGFGAGNKGFALLGDPSMNLAYPNKDVVITQINGHPSPRTVITKDSTLHYDFSNPGQTRTWYTYTYTEKQQNDTIGGLDKVSLAGEIRTSGASLASNFNGKLFVTVYDVQSSIITSETDAGVTRNSSFQERKNILYNGVVTVTGGKWNLNFIVPKDITYIFGKGKISFYALNTDQTDDGNGAWQNLVVGGSNELAGIDTTPPQIRLFMDDTTFIDGGLTGDSPLLLGLLSDSNGINVSTTGIGHEMTAILDNDPSSQQVLNPYYTSDNNDYRKGSISYPYYNLPDGLHRITVKAWDNFNNSNTATVHFMVGSDGNLVIDQILNYPNPFNNGTDFTISHNYAGKPLKVRVEIYNAIGEQIQSLAASYTESSARLGTDGSLKWDLSNANSAVSPGIYLYRITLENELGQTATKAKQLVVIK